MKPPVIHRIVHIEALAPPKPAVGAPCNGCGLCCLAEPCPVGMVLSRRRTGACAKVEWSPQAQRYRCGLMAGWHAPRPIGQGWAHRVATGRWLWRLAVAGVASRWIAAGVGCDADCEVSLMPEGPAPAP